MHKLACLRMYHFQGQNAKWNIEEGDSSRNSGQAKRGIKSPFEIHFQYSTKA